MTKAANLAALGSVVEVPSGSAPSFQCRAWVNFNGTGTVAIRASGNVSSITDNSTGNYNVNFTTAMPDTNYCIAYSDISWGLGYQEQLATTNFKIISMNSGLSVSDVSAIWLSVFR